MKPLSQQRGLCSIDSNVIDATSHRAQKGSVDCIVSEEELPLNSEEIRLDIVIKRNIPFTAKINDWISSSIPTAHPIVHKSQDIEYV